MCSMKIKEKKKKNISSNVLLIVTIKEQIIFYQNGIVKVAKIENWIVKKMFICNIWRSRWF